MNNNQQQKIIRIAVPTNDHISIFPAMLGLAAFFDIYEMNAEHGLILVEKRKNPSQKTMQHQKTLDVYEVIKDCSIIVAGKIGKKGIPRLEAKGMQLLFHKGKIDHILNHIFPLNFTADNIGRGPAA